MAKRGNGVQAKARACPVCSTVAISGSRPSKTGTGTYGDLGGHQFEHPSEDNPRRTYLFERTYRQYSTRLRAFIGFAVAACSRLWKSVWEGPVASVIEVILRIFVFASGLLLSALYVRYELAHGRSFSLGTLPVLVGITLCTGLLMWGWKAPAHLLARAAAAAAAVGLVSAVSGMAFLMVAAVFSVYLLALVTLTACSFSVFLPLRAVQEVWLLYRRITYQCPNDDCTYTGLPIHICKCGARYRDLLPTFYGLFHHTCQHSDHVAKLPTLDILGRNRLPRLCGRCERPLIHSSLGELEVKPILVVGGPAAGKTIFIRQALIQLRERFGALPGNTVRVDSVNQDRALAADLERLLRGQVPAKTAGEVVSALGLALKLSQPKAIRCLLHIFDSPGEHFASVQRFGRKQVLQNTAGIIVLVDPFALPALREHAQSLGAAVSPSSMSFQEIVAVLTSGIDRMRSRGGPAARCDVPVAVVLSKVDALPVSDFPFLADLRSGDGVVADPATEQRCRTALLRLGEGNCIRALEQKFARVSYFACSALGRLPDPRNSAPFTATGVLSPFVWLLGIQEPTAVPRDLSAR